MSVGGGVSAEHRRAVCLGEGGNVYFCDFK